MGKEAGERAQQRAWLEACSARVAGIEDACSARRRAAGDPVARAGTCVRMVRKKRNTPT